MRTHMRALCAVITCVLVSEASPLAAQGRSLPSVQADTETTHTLRDGRQVRAVGRFYRAADGRIREDIGGGALITDLNNATVTILNGQRRQALIIKMPAADNSDPRSLGLGAKADGAQVQTAPYEQGEYQGYRVNKVRTTALNGDKSEVWVASELAVELYSRLEAAGMTRTRVLRNVRAEEPDPTLFTIPEGFEVTEQSAPTGSLSPAFFPTRPKGR